MPPQKEMVALQKTQKDLLDGSRKINEMMEDMEKKEVQYMYSVGHVHSKYTHPHAHVLDCVRPPAPSLSLSTSPLSASLLFPLDCVLPYTSVCTFN